MIDDLSIAYYNLANRYEEQRDWPRAIANYQRALASRPLYISAHNNLALAYEATGRDAEARDDRDARDDAARRLRPVDLVLVDEREAGGAAARGGRRRGLRQPDAA